MQPASDGLAAAAAAQGPSWLGAPRWHFLQRVARALQAAAAARQAGLGGGAGTGPHQALRECLSLHLAALQLLDHALEAHAAAVAAGAEASAAGADAPASACCADAGADGAGASGPAEAVESAGALAAGAAALQAEAAGSMAAAESAADALDKAGREPSPTAVTPAAAAAAEAEAALPDPWELLYSAALGWGREAAVDELLGNQPRSARLYARAGTALSFLCTEAAGLELEPPAELAPADRTRLQKYAAATAVRWAACVASGGEGGILL